MKVVKEKVFSLEIRNTPLPQPEKVGVIFIEKRKYFAKSQLLYVLQPDKQQAPQTLTSSKDYLNYVS